MQEHLTIAPLARITAMRFLPPRPKADGDTFEYFLSPTEAICKRRCSRICRRMWRVERVVHLIC